LKKYIIDVSETRILAFLNISVLGMVSALNDELENLKHADPERAISVCERNRDVIQGIKVRMGKTMVGENGLLPLKRAVKAAEALGMPVMVHPGDTPVPLGEILSEMREGDLLTHCFHGREQGILNESGDILPEAREAVKRGVIFDVGHGKGSFSFSVAERALQQGISPDTISSDLHFYNLFGPVFDLATTLSKFMLLGMPLEEALTKSTTTPARLFGLGDRIGALREGYIADISLFEICEGKFEFVDSMNETRVGSQKLEPQAVIRGGKIYRSLLFLKGR
jgi:dihydroorotase